MAFRAEREQDDIRAVALVSDKLHKDIKEFSAAFDWIVIDAGGRDNAVFRSAVAACDLFCYRFYLLSLMYGLLKMPFPRSKKSSRSTI